MAGQGQDRLNRSPRVGRELAERIADVMAAGGAGWWIGEVPNSARHQWSRPARLGIPRPWFRISNGMPEPVPSPHPEHVLSPPLALAIESGHPLAFGQLGAHDRAQGNRLYAAALRDILGLDLEAIAEACGYGFIAATDANAQRQARDAVSRGRQNLHRLGAWPWLHFSEDGRPPRTWRSEELPSEAADRFERWEGRGITVRFAA